MLLTTFNRLPRGGGYGGYGDGGGDGGGYGDDGDGGGDGGVGYGADNKRLFLTSIADDFATQVYLTRVGPLTELWPC